MKQLFCSFLQEYQDALDRLNQEFEEKLGREQRELEDAISREKAEKEAERVEKEKMKEALVNNSTILSFALLIFIVFNFLTSYLRFECFVMR